MKNKRSTPCKKCGSLERYAHGNCAPCNRARARRERLEKPEMVRRQRGQPEPTRARPDLCEWRGCMRKAICLDHCHTTGAFRGWLCRRHNSALGLLGDTFGDVYGGLNYLGAHQVADLFFP